MFVSDIDVMAPGTAGAVADGYHPPGSVVVAVSSTCNEEGRVSNGAGGKAVTPMGSERPEHNAVNVRELAILPAVPPDEATVPARSRGKNRNGDTQDEDRLAEGWGWTGQPARGKQSLRNKPTPPLSEITGAAAWSGGDTRRPESSDVWCWGPPDPGGANAGSIPASAQPLPPDRGRRGVTHSARAVSRPSHPSQLPASGAPRSSGSFASHTPLSCYPSPPESRRGD